MYEYRIHYTCTDVYFIVAGTKWWALTVRSQLSIDKTSNNTSPPYSAQGPIEKELLKRATPRDGIQSTSLCAVKYGLMRVACS